MKKANDLPQEWFPRFNYQEDVKVIVHWTAGRYQPGDLERDHYHFVIDGEGNSIRGSRPLGTSAPHTYGFNWEIGIGMCCMQGAQSGYNHGKYPMKKQQWAALIDLVSRCVTEYNIPVTKQRVLTHAEVTEVLGVDQWGKWDITELSFAPSIRNPGNDLRTRVLDTTRTQEVVVGRNVFMKLGDKEETLVGILTNSSTFLPVRKLETSGFLKIGKISRGKKHILNVWLVLGGLEGRVPLMLINEVGYVSVRHLEKLGYVVTYNAAEKVVKCIKTPVGETKLENS